MNIYNDRYTYECQLYELKPFNYKDYAKYTKEMLKFIRRNSKHTTFEIKAFAGYRKTFYGEFGSHPNKFLSFFGCRNSKEELLPLMALFSYDQGTKFGFAYFPNDGEKEAIENDVGKNYLFEEIGYHNREYYEYLADEP